ncbi:unnamed protein product [Candidula unifasciata]|uniref:Uncharacterized protein n=1 Tax=Candidula unifasciata TaxID=100452 RepID=A0A8S3Z2V3_9EUPU|nr:unnamed protein product [Candidula unifasciata]
MHQQFLNTPMDNCDPQMYLGQGRFSNLSHQLKAHTTTAAVTLTDLEEATRLRMFQPGFCPAPHVSSNNSCIQRRQPVDTSGLKCPIVMMNNPFQRQTDRDRTAGAVDVAGDPARETSYCQQDPAKDMSYCQQDPARDTSYSQQGPARDMSYCQQDPAKETSYCQQDPARETSYCHAEY